MPTNLENFLKLITNAEYVLPPGPSTFTPKDIQNKNIWNNTCAPKDMQKNIYSSNTCNSPKVKTSKFPSVQWIGYTNWDVVIQWILAMKISELQAAQNDIDESHKNNMYKTSQTHQDECMVCSLCDHLTRYL